MKSIDDMITWLNDDMDRVIKQKPHVENLLRAFKPVILVKYRLLEKVPAKRTVFQPDKLKCEGGIPLIKQQALFFPDDPWRDMAPAITDAIGTGFPHLAADMDILSQNIAGGKLDPYDFFRSPAALDEEKIDTGAKALGIAPPALKLFLHVLGGIILAKRAQDVAGEMATHPWNKGYCPVCGGFPKLAMIREKGQQWLSCSQCAHQWRFPRQKCPYCEKESPAETNYMYIEGERDDMAFTCEKCRRYLLTVNQPGELRETDPDITALSLAHLDLILQDRNFLPMAEGDWTRL